MRGREFFFAIAFFLAALIESNAATTEPLWNQFSGEKAFAHVEQLVNFGPRPAGSSALEKSRVYITDQLRSFGWLVSRQTFAAPTPRGSITFVNLIANFPSSNNSTRPTLLLCSHYDTKRFDTFRFVGANDGGSSTALLIEMARVLATTPKLASRSELVFFDGEEAFENFTATDGLYGSRHFADQLRDSSQAGQFVEGMLFDMVGDKSLTITLPPNSPLGLSKRLFAAAEALKLRQHFTYFDRDVLDDHTPLNEIGIPVIDLIDFDFPPWHTAEDTLDKIGPDSLQIVGRVALYVLSRSDLP